MRIRIEADRARFNREIDARFRTFQKQATVSSRIVATGLEREVDALVLSGITRAANRGRHQGASLGEAIKESIAPFAVGRSQYDVGIRITDPATLSRIATYWHAIEVGSDHIMKVRVVWFGTRQGSLFSAKLTKPGVTTGQPDAIATKLRGYPIKRPITAHKYLETISTRAASRFSARIGVDLQRSFS